MSKILQQFTQTPPGSPLTQDHLSQINAALEYIKQAQRQIDLAVAAGIDVSARQQQLTDAQATLQKIKQVYFPGQ